jgi:hypothetical protein
MIQSNLQNPLSEVIMTAISLDRISGLAATPSSGARLTGRILTGIVAVLLAFDAGIKLAGAKEAVEGTVQLGYQAHHVFPIGLIALGCLILYLIPRTAPLGAVLWTGYFGGAIATQLRVDNPLFTHILAPAYVAALLWTSLYLRDPRVRALLHPAR